MKFYTSYFYKIRFFKPYQIPFSTAVWDPKWFHDFKGQNYTFLDKNGVVNGLRIKELRPGSDCQDLCRGPENCLQSSGNVVDPSTCRFLSIYGKQLDDINYEKFIEYFEKVSSEIQKKLGFTEEPEIIFIVHEIPDNPCSERRKILEVLPKHGIEISEWNEH